MLPTFPGIETRETAEIPDPIIPKATKNHGDCLSPSKKVVSWMFLDVKKEISIKSKK
jgi:hypothetical protein